MGRVCKNEISGFDILRKWMNERIGIHFEVPDLYYMIPSLRESTIRKLVRWLMCAGFISRESRGYYKNDELAMKMIEKRLFAKTNRSKWFK